MQFHLTPLFPFYSFGNNTDSQRSIKEQYINDSWLIYTFISPAATSPWALWVLHWNGDSKPVFPVTVTQHHAPNNHPCVTIRKQNRLSENTLTIPLTPQLGVWIPSFTSFIRVSIAHCCCQQRHSRFNPTPSTTLKLITCHKLTAIRCLSKTFVLSTLWPWSLADSTMYHSKSWRENCRVRLCVHVGSFYARARISRSHDMPVQLTSCSQVHNSTAFTTSHVMHPPASCLNVWKCFFPPTIPCLCVLRLKCLNGDKHQKAILV